MSDSRPPTPTYTSAFGETTEPAEEQKMGWAAVIYLTLIACLVLVVMLAAVQSRELPSRDSTPSGVGGP